MSLADLRAALNAELAATPEYYDFKVLRSERDGALWRVTLEPGYVYAEGQRPGPASAQVLLDVSDLSDDEVNTMLQQKAAGSAAQEARAL